MFTLILKRCPSCGHELELSCFYKDKNTKDGLGAYCRTCVKAKAAARYANPETKARIKTQQAEYYRQNTEVIKERTAAYRRKHPEVYKKATQEWHERNPDYRPQYYLANRERMLATNAAWLARNPEWCRAKEARRRAAHHIPYTVEQLIARLSMWSGCWMCGCTANAIDHVKPLAKGGWDCLSNLRPICTPCNSRKSAKWPLAVSVLRGCSYLEKVL